MTVVSVGNGKLKLRRKKQTRKEITEDPPPFPLFSCREAESAIRDMDMAEEMVAYSNNNVLLQAGQSMLAQANQANQGILSLLG